MKAGAKMKKITKVISVMLAVILVIMAVPFTTSGATIGDVDGNGTVAATDARLILQVVAGLKKESDLKNAAAADVDGVNGITATDARRVLQMVAGLDTPSGDSQKAQLAELFNTETAKAAKGDYKWARECDFTKDINVGEASETLNRIIQMIDANADLNSVVGSFLGVGNSNGNQSNAGKYAIIPMSLTENDIKSVVRDAEQITLLLNDSKNPSKGGNTPLNHVSNDFVTEDDVKNAVSGVTTVISVSGCSFDYYDIKLTARLDSNGNPESLTISYKMYATMGLDVAGMNVNGNGEVKTVLEYTDLKY